MVIGVRQERSLGDYRSKAMLITNVASRCGFTPQYEGLEQMFEEYADQGLVVLGFPCDQFAHQEPGDETAIHQFCTLNYGVSFPMFAKVQVNGRHAHPLYRWLRSEQGGALGDRIKWNFTKFLVDQNGAVVKRFAPSTKPEKIAADVQAILGI